MESLRYWILQVTIELSLQPNQSNAACHAHARVGMSLKFSDSAPSARHRLRSLSRSADTPPAHSYSRGAIHPDMIESDADTIPEYPVNPP